MSKRVGHRPSDPTSAPAVSVPNSTPSQHSDSNSAPSQASDPVPNPPENIANDDSDEFYSFNSLTGPESSLTAPSFSQFTNPDGRRSESSMDVDSQQFDSRSGYIVYFW